MEDQRFIVYGAGRIGKGIVDLLLKMDIKVDMIWDRSPEKKKTYREIPVLNPYENKKILENNTDKSIIIGLANPLENKKISEYLKNKGYKYIYSFSKENDNDIIQSLCNVKKVADNCVVCAYVENCNKFIDKNMEKIYGSHTIDRTKIINVMAIELTNRCTLNCQYCAQCTDIIREKFAFCDMTLERMKKCMSIILQEVPYIHQLALTGGEVLLCRELPEILNYLCNIEQIGYIKILTTATVDMPDSLLQTMKHDKIALWVDDYGEDKNIPMSLQNNIEKNKDKLFREKIQYCRIDNSDGTWYNLGNTERREEVSENKRKNQECMFRTCLIVSPRGNLSWCSRNISCFECGLIPDDKRDYCNLLDEKDCGRIREILELKYLNGCEYCNGTSEKNMVRAGVQSLLYRE